MTTGRRRGRGVPTLPPATVISRPVWCQRQLAPPCHQALPSYCGSLERIPTRHGALSSFVLSPSPRPLPWARGPSFPIWAASGLPSRCPRPWARLSPSFPHTAAKGIHPRHKPRGSPMALSTRTRPGRADEAPLKPDPQARPALLFPPPRLSPTCVEFLLNYFAAPQVGRGGFRLCVFEPRALCAQCLPWPPGKPPTVPQNPGSRNGVTIRLPCCYLPSEAAGWKPSTSPASLAARGGHGKAAAWH